MASAGMGGLWQARGWADAPKDLESVFNTHPNNPDIAHAMISDDASGMIPCAFTSNPALRNVHPSWAGTPLDEHGRFMNHEFPFIQGFDALLRWKLGTNPQEEQKRIDTWMIRVEDADGVIGRASDMVVPLGHASFFIQFGGRRLVIDPVFFGLPGGMKRRSRLPVDPDRLRDIDLVLVSHAHYDHCDRKSISLLARNNPGMQILAGLGMAPLVGGWAPGVRVQEAGWYQAYDLDSAVAGGGASGGASDGPSAEAGGRNRSGGLEIVFVPTRHWSNRVPWDVNRRLWGGFVIRAGGRSIYINGDSGFGSHYRETADLFGPMDLALIGSGAYSPRWFMQSSHQDPQQAVQAFSDLKAGRMLPFHYGTFDLSDEPPSEPEAILRWEAASKGWGDRLQLPVLGRAVEI
jgi:L-ascorbate metabolism protein UlaG (beta-lactamase superfamily)